MTLLVCPCFHDRIDTAARSEDFTVRLIPRLGNYIDGFPSDDDVFRLPSLCICLFDETIIDGLKALTSDVQWGDCLSLQQPLHELVHAIGRRTRILQELVHAVGRQTRREHQLLILWNHLPGTV